MISQRLAEEVLARALCTGGDFAEIFQEDRMNRTLDMRAGLVENAQSTRLCGVGVRVFRGVSAAYAYTSDISRSGLLACAQKAADALTGTQAQAVSISVSERVNKNIHPIAQTTASIDAARKIAMLSDVTAAAKGYSEEIAQVLCRLLDWDQNVLIANSEGLYTADRRMYTRLIASAVAASGTENQTGGESPGAMMGWELFGTRVDPKAVGERVARQAVTMLHAPACPAGVMPVVIDNGFGGVIFHEACGHSLEATSVGRGMSEFCGKLGTQIAAPCVTAIDDGTMPNEWGSENIDDEGTPTTKLTLIENGVLKNYMIDRLGSRRMNMPMTGSGRRQGYTFAATSRMRNTYIAAGTDDEGEMIATMGEGLYAKQMGGGSVNPVTGEFNFSVLEAYLVKDGKIAHPVRGASLIGRGGEVLTRIDRVGRDMRMAQGMCGSLSGSVPTNVGQPMIRVRDMTVGGKQNG